MEGTASSAEGVVLHEVVGASLVLGYARPSAVRSTLDSIAVTLAVAAGLAGAFLATACSSSPPATNQSGTDADTDAPPAGLYDGAGAGGDAGIMCSDSTACASGQVCCGAANMTTNCQAGPCPDVLGMGPIQLCNTSFECFTAGDICEPIGLMLPAKECRTPRGDGGEGGSSSGGDTGTSDAPTDD